jgi:hypothetical protein
MRNRNLKGQPFEFKEYFSIGFYRVEMWDSRVKLL